MNHETITDFLSTDYLSQAREFIPTTRQEYLLHMQRVYNLKLHTPFPLIVHIEPTNICNQRCIMCCHPSMRRKGKIIDEALMLKALSECASSPVWFVHFFFFGEPFVNKKSVEYIRIAKEKGIQNTSVTTNFTLLNKKDIRGLVDSGIDSIHISFNGKDASSYRNIHKTDSYTVVKRNIEYLLEYREKRAGGGPWVSLTRVQTTESSEEMDNYRDYWMKRVDNVHVSPQFEYRNGGIDGAARPEIMQGSTFSNAGDILARNNDNSRIACRQLWTRLVVLANGELVPCSQNIDGELSLGNLADMSIADAWCSPQMARLRMDHISNNLSPDHVCSPCTDWDWSGRVDKRPRLQGVSAPEQGEKQKLI